MSTSMECKLMASLVPKLLVSTSTECKLMASLVSRLTLCAPVQSTIPRFASFPGSPCEHKSRVQTQG